jgi:hypothetical protein
MHSASEPPATALRAAASATNPWAIAALRESTTASSTSGHSRCSSLAAACAESSIALNSGDTVRISSAWLCSSAARIASRYSPGDGALVNGGRRADRNRAKNASESCSPSR